MDLAPLKDDPALAADPQRNNDFDYSFPGDFDTQDRCPFAAHVRKTNPRNDLQNNTETRRIVRRGIPFGPEVSSLESQSGRTLHDRGLLFRCYQSVIANGFQFIQQCELPFHPNDDPHLQLSSLGEQHWVPLRQARRPGSWIRPYHWSSFW